MMKKQRFILLIISVIFFVPHIVSAQDDLPLVRFGYGHYSTNYYNSSEIMFSNFETVTEPDMLTKYYAVQSGTHTIEFTPSGENGSTFSSEIALEAGNRYSVIYMGADQPPVTINETAAESELELAEGENALTIVTSLGSAAFKVLDNVSASPRDRQIFEYNGYLQSSIGASGVVVQRLDPQTEAIISSINIPYFPNTNILINGDGLNDLTTPVVINYSTSLSAADWLAGINGMENPPFTFNQFINSAVAGGFDAALAQCEDYMWFAWIDSAFDSQSSDNQSFISGVGAGTILNNSVHEGATTTPWFISPTTTRGGTPLFVGDPLAELDNATMTAGVVSGNILMTVSTTGNDVQNVIHITDAIPISDTPQAQVENYNLYPSRTRLNLVLPLGS
jgi:hypothetical protein